MKKEDLLEAMSFIKEDYIMEAKQENRKTGKVRWGLGTAAAVIALSILLPNTNANMAMAMGRMPLLGKYFQVVTFRDYQHDENNKIADIKVPQIEAEEAAPINQSIQEYTDALLKEFQADVETGNDNFRELDINYEVTMDTDTWFTLKINALEVQASGAGQVRYYHIDKATGQVATLADLFAEGSDYVGVISEEIKRQMREQMQKDEGSVYFIDGESEVQDGFVQIAPDEDFYLTETGDLVIVFDEYQVAPGYMGCPEFVIPGQLLEGIR